MCWNDLSVVNFDFGLFTFVKANQVQTTWWSLNWGRDLLIGVAVLITGRLIGGRLIGVRLNRGYYAAVRRYNFFSEWTNNKTSAAKSGI